MPRPLLPLLVLIPALVAAPVRLAGQAGTPADTAAGAVPVLPVPFDSAASVAGPVPPPPAPACGATPPAAAALPGLPLPARPAAADARPARRWMRTLPTVGGAAEEALRAAQLRGEAPATGFLLRAPSSLAPAMDGRGPRAAVLAPEVLLAWNSRLPYSVLDGALWAGRGASALGRVGIEVQAGPVRLIAAPEVVYAANASFDTLVPPHWREGDAQTFFPDWQFGEHSIDLPYRMGDGSLTELRPGQSSLTVTAGPVAFGAATENQWWGPGIRSALVLSNQAAGFGHLFVRTSRPLRTPAGTIEARWMGGALRESRWYADVHGRERAWRSFGAAAVVLTPAPGVSVGLARSVYAPAGDGWDAVAGGARVFTRWNQTRPRAGDPSEQITALFGRLVLPAAGAEVYAEWARTRLPVSARDLLEAPAHSQGYTVGLQWLRALGAGDLRVQAEHTYLEESITWLWRGNGSWYASAVVPQGYTHEGQVLGSPVGPGGSGQWLAADWLRGRGRGGVFLGRVRWAQDAYYNQPGGFNRYLAYDVSVFGGVRTAWPLAGGVRLEVEYGLEHRWNVFFQNPAVNFLDRGRGVRVRNHLLRAGFTADAPRLGHRR